MRQYICSTCTQTWHMTAGQSFAQYSFSQTMRAIIYFSTLLIPALFPTTMCSGGKIYHSKLHLFLTSQNIQMNLNLEKYTLPSMMWMWLTSTLFRLKGNSCCHFERTMFFSFLAWLNVELGVASEVFVTHSGFGMVHVN